MSSINALCVIRIFVACTAMGKRGKGQKKDNRNPKRIFRNNDVASDDMDDEIDACKLIHFFFFNYFCN